MPDFSGPFEVFSTASRLSNPADFFNVFIVVEEKSPVSAKAGYSINPHYDFNDHPEIDVLIVAGGIHTEELVKPTVINWLATVEKTAQLVASVCTGAFTLAEAGLLSGLEVTTHWEDISDLQASYPDTTVVDSQRWVDVSGRLGGRAMPTAPNPSGSTRPRAR